MATCEFCGCELRRTVETPIDRSLAFTALLELDKPFGQLESGKGSERITEFLADWRGSGHTDMYAYAKEWIPAHPHDGNPYLAYTPEHRVWDKAQEHGKAAASWVFDGNTPESTYRTVLQGIRDGDPEVLDSLPAAPGFDNQDYTAEQLMTDAGWVPHDGTVLRDELTDQYLIEVATAYRWEVERLARDHVEPVTSVPELNEKMEPDHVIRVLDENRVTDATGSYAPELIMYVDSDGQSLPDSDADLHEQAKSAGWRLLSGWTGQYHYSGPVMHPSEFIGGALARHILDTPGEYVAVVVECLGEGEDEDGEEPAGWAVAFREVTE